MLGNLLQQAHKDRNDFEPKVSGLAQHVSGQLRPTLVVLACAVGVVMLIVCANLSNLLLARGAGAEKRDRDSYGDGSGAWAVDWADVDGEFSAVVLRGGAGIGAGVCGDARAGAFDVGQYSFAERCAD